MVTDCRKELAKLVCQQAQRNYKVLEKQHRLDMLKEILKISAVIAGYLKIKLGKQDSSANEDVIAKAALLNLFHYSFDMMEKFHDDDKDDDDWTRNSKKIQLARHKSILNKADAELVALYRSDEAHSLANAIEEKVDAGVDTNSDNKNNHHQNNIYSKMMNPNNKGNQK